MLLKNGKKLISGKDRGAIKRLSPENIRSRKKREIKRRKGRRVIVRVNRLFGRGSGVGDGFHARKEAGRKRGLFERRRSGIRRNGNVGRRRDGSFKKERESVNIKLNNLSEKRRILVIGRDESGKLRGDVFKKLNDRTIIRRFRFKKSDKERRDGELSIKRSGIKITK